MKLKKLLLLVIPLLAIDYTNTSAQMDTLSKFKEYSIDNCVNEF